MSKLEKAEKLTTLQKLDLLTPKMPSVFGVYTNSVSISSEVYNLYPQQIEFKVECLTETASINMVGKWKNISSHYMHGVFMIPMRSAGSVTDCFVNIGKDRVRTIGLRERNEMKIGQEYELEKEYELMQELDVEIKINTKVKTENDPPQEWDLIEDLFANQIPGYFRLPFDRVKPQQQIRIDLYYTEQLQMKSNAFYLNLPTTFDVKQISSTQKWNDVLSINATIYHPIHAKVTVMYLYIICI